MTPYELQSRQSLLERSDAALERWPHRTGYEFEHEMEYVACELEALAGQADTSEADTLERARTWRYAAIARFDQGASTDLRHLAEARVDLERAEALLQRSEDPIERMKLDYIFGLVMLGLSGAKDVRFAREARRRLAEALDLARRHCPEAVDSAREELNTAERVLTLLEQAEALDRRSAELQRQLRQSEPKQSTPRHAPEIAAMFELLQNTVAKEKPEFDPVRREGIDQFMGRLSQLVTDYGAAGSLDKHVEARGRLDALMAEFRTRLKKPSLKGLGPLAGSRGDRVLAALQDLKLFVAAAGSAYGVADGDREHAFELTRRIARLTTRISEAGSDEEALARIETDEARGLAHEVRVFARRAHVALARPVWAHRNVQADPDRVFFSGPATVHAAFARVASRLSVEANQPLPVGADFAERRWQDLRTANIAIFDLSGGDPQVYYELGIALVLGTELVLLARENTVLHFDVAQNVRHYAAPEELDALLHEEITGALYGLQAMGGRTDSLAATLAYATRLAAADGDNPLLRIACQMLEKASGSPVRFHAALKAFNGYLGVREHELLFPRWPVRYASPLEQRCFIVMPFRPELEGAYAAIAHAADHHGVRYVRGDVAEGQQIIESIWEEICRATHITADLTGLNPNVCLELGIAHTLGRPTLLVAREGTEHQLHERLPSVAKWRCHTYGDYPESKPDFMGVLGRFLGAATT